MLNLKYQKNDQFTTASLGCFFSLPMTQHNLVCATVLTTMQENATGPFATIKAQSEALSDAYEMTFSPGPEVIGNRLIIGYTTNFVEPDEILDPDYDYAQMIKRFFTMTKMPRLDERLLVFAKHQLQEEANEFFEDPANSAAQHFFELLYQDQPDFAYSVFGPLKAIQALTLESLNQFCQLLKKTPSYCLSHTRGKIQQNLIPYLDWAGFHQPFPNRQIVKPTIQTPIDQVVTRPGLQQEQLLLGFTYTKQPISLAEQMATRVLAYYLGGDESSKLFIKVREEMSAAYFISAYSYRHNGLLLIQAGLEKGTSSAVKHAILDVITALQQGDFDDALFQKAKKGLINHVFLSQDSQAGQLLNSLSQLLTDDNETVAERVRVLDQLQKKDLIALSQKLQLKESYCLK